MPWISFLWHNVIGAFVVLTVGMLISALSMLRPQPSR
jgi:hypothetical protein